MNLCELIKNRRSIRYFRQEPLERQTLIELLDAARCAPSAGNRQPLEYIIVDDSKLCPEVFKLLAWAGYVRPRRNPPEGKQPVAYIIVLRNPAISQHDWSIADAAAAIENILLAALAKGIGSCWLASVQRENLRKTLIIPENLEIDSVIALGLPAEQPVMEDTSGDSIEYYLDENDRLHVPKRKLSAIGYINRYGIPISQ